MINERKLELLGLGAKEARLYLTALSLPLFTVTEIAKKSGLKRPTCYLLLEELGKQGLISIIPRARKRFYKAESPEVLIRKSKQQYLYAEKLIPGLLNLFKENKESVIIRAYYGQKGVQNIYEDSLHSGSKDIYYIGAVKAQVEMAGDEFMRQYIEERIKRRIKSFAIRMRGDERDENIYAGTKGLLREIRYAPQEIYIPDTVMLYGSKVAFVSTAKGNFGFIIESPELYQTVLGLFQALWQLSTAK